MSARYHWYVFQKSYIWEAGNAVDPSSKPVRISARNEARARRKLTKELGRVWVLISIDDKPTKEK